MIPLIYMHWKTKEGIICYKYFISSKLEKVRLYKSLQSMQKFLRLSQRKLLLLVFGFLVITAMVRTEINIP